MPTALSSFSESKRTTEMKLSTSLHHDIVSATTMSFKGDPLNAVKFMSVHCSTLRFLDCMTFLMRLPAGLHHDIISTTAVLFANRDLLFMLYFVP